MNSSANINNHNLAETGMSPQKIVCVLGMHRSGTSAVASGLRVLGINLGDNLMPANEYNAKGYWEDMEIYALNVEMLNFLGQDWHFLTHLQNSDVENLRKNNYLSRAVQLIRRKTENKVKPFGFKDPRLSKLLLFWKEVFASANLQPHYVLVIRHPRSVCHSLARRDGFDIEKSYLLWLEYVIGSLVNLVDENCVVVSYENLVESPETTLRKMAQSLKFETDESEFGRYAGEFIDKKLQHTVYQPDDLLQDDVPDLVKDVYFEILEIARGNKQLDDIKEKIFQWNDEFRQQKFLFRLVDKLAIKIEERDFQLAERNARLSEIQLSKEWQLAAKLKEIRIRLLPQGSRLEQLGKALFFRLVQLEQSIGFFWKKAWELFGKTERQYRAWMRNFDTLSEAERQVVCQQVGKAEYKSLISVLMTVYNPSLDFLDQAINSVCNQFYPNWELCIADDASPNPEVQALIQKYARQDSRIRYIFRDTNGHISAASNSALELARGDYIALLDHDDKLHPLALYYVAKEIAAHPESEIIYSDEDKLNLQGKRIAPYFKPDFDYHLLLSQNMVSHLGVYKTETVRQVGGFREGFEGSQDYDLALRIVERITAPNQIRHIPRVLYHWRISDTSTASGSQAKPYAYDAGLRAIREHLSRRKISASVELIPGMDSYRVLYSIPEPQPSVEIIIYARSLSEKLKDCVDTLLAGTQYRYYKISLCINNAEVIRARSAMGQDSQRFSVMPSDEANVLTAINRLVKASDADYICVLDERLGGFPPTWLTHLLGQAVQAGVGAVSPKVLRPDNTIYSCGLILGQKDIAAKIFAGMPGYKPGYFGWAALQRGYSALTGECLLINRALFLKMGGLDEEFETRDSAVINLCLRLKAQGLNNVTVPFVELRYHQPIGYNKLFWTLDLARFAEDARQLKERWQPWFDDDPAFNPNLVLSRGKLGITRDPHIQKF